jgi:subtilisin family serine protease
MQSDLPNPQDLVRLYFPSNSDVKKIAKELKELPEVKQAVPVFKVLPPTLILGDPLLGSGDTVELDPSTGLENQWYIFRCGADKAWNYSTGENVIVADIDWGYIVTHEDLSHNLDLQNAYNSFDGGTNVSFGESSHGTAVMGIIGASSNDVGLRGFSPKSSLWPIQSDNGPGPDLGGDAWARAIDWVRTRNSNDKRKVIILEVQTGLYGNIEGVPSVNLAIRKAISSGVVVCVAAGNGNRDADINDSGDMIPVTGSILVGATQYDPVQNKRARFSNFGSQITVCAPGDLDHDVTCSSISNNEYRNGFGGTSGATPKVAGTVALMLSVNPDLSHEEVRQILINTGMDVISEQGKPVGRFLNTHAAVETAKSSLAS